MAAIDSKLTADKEVESGDVCEVLYIDETKVRLVAGRMPREEAVSAVTEVFKILNDPTRVKIVFALSQAELCVCDLAALVGISISAVSHQLRLLRALQLVRFRKSGRLAYYSLADEHTVRLLCDALAHVQRNANQVAPADSYRNSTAEPEEVD